MNLGKIAYDAYCKISGNKSLVSGAQLPTWDQLDRKIQIAWEASGMAVRLEIQKPPVATGDLTEAARRGFESVQTNPRVTCPQGHVYEANPYRPCSECEKEDRIADILDKE